jgi:DnaJ-domain-containing protein 1
VKQTAGKIHVESDPFDEDEWARRSEGDGGPPDPAPRPRTLAVDRLALRREGRFHVGRAQVDLTFYASEQAGISDVEAALTAKHAWCAVLGVRFPCAADDIKAAYRRLAFRSHPDRGGDAAVFRSVEQAYRAALAYFSKDDDATGS